MCVGLVASSTEEMAARSIAYHAHGTAETVTNTAVIHGLCAMTAMHPLLAQARPRIINHLTSIYSSVYTIAIEVHG